MACRFRITIDTDIDSAINFHLNDDTYVVFFGGITEELFIFWYLNVVPSGTVFPYATIKWKINEEEHQRNVVSTSATADLHTYFLRMSALKFTFLLKNNNHA